MSAVTHTDKPSHWNAYLPQPSANGERLIDALLKYHADGDISRLEREYNRHQADIQALGEPPDLVNAIYRGICTFNFFPASAHERYTAVTQRNDADALRADWEAVGEYLSFALITQILNEEEADE